MHKITNPVIEETVFKRKLTNGLDVFVIPRMDFQHQYAVFSADCGSIDLEYIDSVSGKKTTVPPGTAHFLEHKLFEDKEESIFNAFAALGSSTNAYTGFTSTSYLFSSTINFLDSLLRLIDFVQNPYFTEKSVDKEKDIISQEIKMYEDSPGWQIFFNLLQGLYINHPVQHDIAGTVASIQKITAEKLHSFYRTFYHPANMVLVISGNINPEEIFQRVEANQEKKDYFSPKKPKSFYPGEPDFIAKEKIKLNMNVTRPMFAVGFKECRLNLKPEELIKQKIITSILLDIIIGKSSDLYRKLYGDNLIDDNFSANYNLKKNFGFVNINGKTDNPDKLFARLITELKDCEKYITEKNFQRIYKKFYGEFVSTFNSIERTISKFISFYFQGVNFINSLDILEKITINDLKLQYNNLFREREPVRVLIN